MLERFDAVHGRQFAASWRPEFVAVEVMGQGLLLHGLNQSCQLVTCFQPFCDAQGLRAQRRSTGLKHSHSAVVSRD